MSAPSNIEWILPKYWQHQVFQASVYYKGHDVIYEEETGCQDESVARDRLRFCLRRNAVVIFLFTVYLQAQTPHFPQQDKTSRMCRQEVSQWKRFELIIQFHHRWEPAKYSPSFSFWYSFTCCRVFFSYVTIFRTFPHRKFELWPPSGNYPPPLTSNDQ